MIQTIEYLRVSTDRQAESGLGIEAQQARNRKMLAMLGLPPTTHGFADEVSASVRLADRRNGEAMLTHIRDASGVMNVEIVLIAYSLDRLFRDVDDGRATLKWLDERGVKVLLSNEGGNAIDASSAMGRFLITIRLAQGELERGLTGERTKAALGALKARGGQLGEPPYGWRKTDERARFEIDQSEQDVIVKVLDLADQGSSQRAIAEQLNRSNIRTRDNRQWSHTQIRRILQRAEEAE